VDLAAGWFTDRAVNLLCSYWCACRFSRCSQKLISHAYILHCASRTTCRFALFVDSAYKGNKVERPCPLSACVISDISFMELA
jgi:hypothetical protein